MQKLIKFLNELRRFSSYRVFVDKMLQMGLLAGHQVQEFDTIELVLNRDSRLQTENSCSGQQFIWQVVEIKAAVTFHYIQKRAAI